MKTVTVEIPDSVHLDKKEAAMILAVKLYEQGMLSSGQAAEMAGYSKRAFLESLGKYNVPLFTYDPTEIATDIKNAAGHNS